jgi:FkbM family methyltransferase
MKNNGLTLIDKIKHHLKDLYEVKNLQFTKYRLLHILNRRIPLPNNIFNDKLKRTGKEAHLRKYLIPNKGVFIDIGAHEGTYTEFIAKKGYRVYAFEPSQSSLLKLQELEDRYPTIKVYPHALGESNYVASLSLHYNTGHNSLKREAPDFLGQKSSVQVLPLDDFNFNNIDVIKIDTEGYEVPILKGAKKTIMNEKPRLVIEVHEPYIEQEKAIRNILVELNYSCKTVYKKYGAKYQNPQFHLICHSNDSP